MNNASRKLNRNPHLELKYQIKFKKVTNIKKFIFKIIRK